MTTDFDAPLRTQTIITDKVYYYFDAYCGSVSLRGSGNSCSIWWRRQTLAISRRHRREGQLSTSRSCLFKRVTWGMIRRVTVAWVRSSRSASSSRMEPCQRDPACIFHRWTDIGEVQVGDERATLVVGHPSEKSCSLCGITNHFLYVCVPF